MRQMIQLSSTTVREAVIINASRNLSEVEIQFRKRDANRKSSSSYLIPKIAHNLFLYP